MLYATPLTIKERNIIMGISVTPRFPTEEEHQQNKPKRKRKATSATGKRSSKRPMGISNRDKIMQGYKAGGKV
jgi:hypothetical protein